MLVAVAPDRSLVDALRGAASDAPADERPARPSPRPPGRPRRRARSASCSRWAWRQLTSMRTALILLLLLALAAIPGSVIPQEDVDALAVVAVAGRPPEAGAGLRAARAVLGLRLAVVRRDLHPADGLAGRLHHPAALRLLARRCAPSRPRRRATCRGCRRTRRTAPTRTPDVVLERAAAHAAAQALPGRRRPRHGADGAVSRRARLPARGRQPALPPRRAWWCWSASPTGSLFGYKGGVIVLVGQRLLQQPDPVRRLRPRAACSTRRPGAFSSASTTSTSSG